MKLDSPLNMQFFRVFPAMMASVEGYMGLDAEQNGILFGIMNHQAVNGSVPTSVTLLARIVRAEESAVERFLREFSDLKTLQELEGGPDDRLAIPYLHFERASVLADMQKKRLAGAKGGRITQAKARAAALKLATYHLHQAGLQAEGKHHSTRQEQDPEQEQEKDNSNSNPDDDAAEYELVPADIRFSLDLLGIGSQNIAGVLTMTGGPKGLRAAVEQLAVKMEHGDIHSPSGFFLTCAAELAKEGLASFDKLYSEVSTAQPKALLDTRWLALPDGCRESLEVLQSWWHWWTLNEFASNANAQSQESHSREVSDAWFDLVESVVRHHPKQRELESSGIEKLKGVGPAGELPGLARRIRLSAIAKQIGIVEKS
jgi:hypothetical protein